ncbi:MAG: hypothetical protein ACD_48C00316G0001 [uncultured bacterium]|nr:MAG: hypothetical protein ACD_48C00316G0001 [uncultured bacterium]
MGYYHFLQQSLLKEHPSKDNSHSHRATSHTPQLFFLHRQDKFLAMVDNNSQILLFLLLHLATREYR